MRFTRYTFLLFKNNTNKSWNERCFCVSSIRNCEAQFDRLAESWWDCDGKFKLLHRLNPLRVTLLQEMLEVSQPSLKLAGLHVADVGCGGGILAECLVKCGAKVVGIDMSEKGIEIAKVRQKLRIEDGGECEPVIDFRNESAASLAQKYPESFDVVVASEVVEHVDDVSKLIEDISLLLKEKGHLFITTINRTALSFLFAKVAAEYVFHFAPKGIHNWNSFIKPSELIEILERHKMQACTIVGMAYKPLCQKWIKTKNTSVHYALHAVKEKT